MTLKDIVNTIFERVSLDESMETLIVGSTVGPAVRYEKLKKFFKYRST